MSRSIHMTLPEITDMIDHPSVDLADRMIALGARQNGLDRAYYDDKRTFVLALLSTHQSPKALTPMQLLSIRNTIVEILCNKKHINVILKTIGEFKKQPYEPTVDQKKGSRQEGKREKQRNFFRLWLDVLTKLTNAPSRLQCSVRLEVPRRTNNVAMVARLVYSKSGELERMFYLDKVGKQRRMPVSFPLGRFLSFFTAAYLMYLTPASSNHLFDNSPTVRWAGRSSKFIDFLTARGVGPVSLPFWIFQHQKTLRRIGVNALGVKFRFNHQSMEDVAVVSRHTINILLQEYAFWSGLYRERHHEMDNTPNVYYYTPPDLTSDAETLLPDVYQGMDGRYPHAPVDDTGIPTIPEEAPIHPGYKYADKPVFFEGVLPICTACGRRTIFHMRDRLGYFLVKCPHLDQHEFFVCHLPILPANPKLSEDVLLLAKTTTTQAGKAKPPLDVQDKRNVNKRYKHVCDIPIPIDRSRIYVGMDLSDNGIAVCFFKTVTDYTIWYVINEEHRVDPHDRLHVIVNDGLPMENQLLALIREKTWSCSNVCIVYEKPLPDSQKIRYAQRKLADTIINHMRANLPAARFEPVSNNLVKTTWRRSFGSENVLDRKHTKLYRSIQTHIKQYESRGATSTMRQQSKHAHKLANYIVWIARRLPTLGVHIEYTPAEDGIGMAQMITEASNHPVSDIVDSYLLARHLYFLDVYSGRRFDPDMVPDEEKRVEDDGDLEEEEEEYNGNLDEKEEDKDEDDTKQAETDIDGFSGNHWLLPVATYSRQAGYHLETDEADEIPIEGYQNSGADDEDETATYLDVDPEQEEEDADEEQDDEPGTTNSHDDVDSTYERIELTNAKWDIKYGHRKMTDSHRLVVGEYETGVYIGAGGNYHDSLGEIRDYNDDTHVTTKGPGQVDFFVFVRRAHETNRHERNRLRRERDVWRSLQPYT